ncbi:MAG: hypothetical protein AAFV33_11715 [Chloroflexota bacterium]
MEPGTLSDFFNQLQGQRQIVGIFVLFGVMFFMTFGLYFIIQARKVMNRNKPDDQQPPQPDIITKLMDWIKNQSGGSPAMRGSGGGPSTVDAAMPDLDMLLSTAETAAASSGPSPSGAPVPRQPGVVNISMADGRVVEAAEMLIIARDRVTDNLVVQIGELAYDGTESNVDVSYQRRFNKLMRELGDIAPVLGNGGTAPAPQQAPSFAELIQEETPSPRKPKRPAPSKATVTVATVEEPAELDLAGQIDLFLQKRLQTNPELADRGLQVRGAADGTVQIYLDGQVYPGVGEVEDTKVRSYLQETIAEWQSRQ